MKENLHAVEKWAGALLSKLSPGQRRLLNQEIVINLRRTQARRIASQTAPDGEPFARRRNRKNIRDKSGRIKRQKAAMFSNLRKARHLKVRSDTNQLLVGFFGWVADVAGIHHMGRTDRVSKNGPLYHYAARPLLGFSEQDRSDIRNSLLQHLSRA